MAEDTFKHYVIGFILFSLFGMLLISATLSMSNTYSKDTTGVTDGSLDLQKFNKSINNVEQNSKDLKASFDKGSIWSAIAGVVVEGIFGIAKDMALMMLAPFDILTDILNDNFGVPAYVTSIMLGILIISVILGIWALIKVGN